MQATWNRVGFPLPAGPSDPSATARAAIPASPPAVTRSQERLSMRGDMASPPVALKGSSSGEPSPPRHGHLGGGGRGLPVVPGRAQVLAGVQGHLPGDLLAG